MVNRYKAAGIVLIILGIVVIVGSPIYIVPGEETDVRPFIIQEAFGIGMTLVGITFYFEGNRAEKEKGLNPAPKAPD